MRRAPLPLVLLALLIVPLALPSAATADVVHLRTGAAVKGRPIQERSDEKSLAIEDYQTGMLRRFAWEALDPEDRDRLQELWGWKNTDQGIVEGHRLVMRLVGGDEEEVLGLIEREDDQYVYIRRGGKVLKVAKSTLVSTEEEPLDARRIWTPEQLVERLQESMKEQGVDVDNLTARDHWRIATYADWAGALELARDHYAACAADEEFLKRDLAAQRLKRIESLLQDQAALKTLKDARLKLGVHLFRRAREILDGFAEKHPEASEAVQKEVEATRAQVNESRTQYFQMLARRSFVKIVEDLIEDKVREKDVLITDVTSWTRRELPEQAFTKLAEKKLGRYDDVTPEEAKTFWDGRRKGSWKRVSYGGGTFITNPPKIKPPKRRKRPSSRRGGRGGSAPKIQIPKPPTRDQWWAAASTKERTSWTLAYFVERSELFEVGPEPDLRPCSICHGIGLLSKTLQTGDVLSYLCTRCGGAQNDVVLKYR